ncbi:MAG: hypothetical protein UV67_C0011G0013 [Parcubacteria group bacterium GW2011_GWC1_43_12]|nr:MAG: hypothetical protein UV34_C0020G0007 [Parcubacteria group bacterium GW2011_GWB1_42_6]KKS92057.1 MAG: hypothetical protein UV67_C0011G0013 [Parcubacteria group bacterium GW2011_GWC1_43_12]
MDTNTYNFEEFTSFKGKFSSKISLGKTGGFGFSSGFYNKYNLKDSVALKIFYDKEKMAVAFKFFKNEESGAIKLKPRATGGYVASRSFIGKYGINPLKYAGRYEPKEVMSDNLGKVYVIELKEKQSSPN